MNEKEKRVAIVTGGSRGIGRAICIELAKYGYYVIINYKSNEKAANETLEIIKNNQMKICTAYNHWEEVNKSRKGRKERYLQ